MCQYFFFWETDSVPILGARHELGFRAPLKCRSTNFHREWLWHVKKREWTLLVRTHLGKNCRTIGPPRCFQGVATRFGNLYGNCSLVFVFLSFYKIIAIRILNQYRIESYQLCKFSMLHILLIIEAHVGKPQSLIRNDIGSGWVQPCLIWNAFHRNIFLCNVNFYGFSKIVLSEFFFCNLFVGATKLSYL